MIQVLIEGFTPLFGWSRRTVSGFGYKLGHCVISHSIAGGHVLETQIMFYIIFKLFLV